MSTVYHDFFPLRTQAVMALDDTVSATDVAVIPVPYKCQVRRVGLLFTSTDTAAADVTFDQRVTAGSDTNRVTFATISKTAVSRQGKYLYEDPATSVILNEGDEIVIADLAVTADAGDAWGIVLVERVPEQPANQADMVAG